MILLLGVAADETFVYTLQAARAAGLALRVVDVAELILAGDVVLEPGGGWLAVDDERVELAAVRGAYVRLIELAGAAPDPVLARRARAVDAVLRELFDTAPFRVVNPPSREASNFTKLLHGSELARIAGALVPRTCVTQDPDEAQAFAGDLPEGAIYKGASARKTWASVYDPETDAARLERLAVCPVLFQERIVGPDVRVHVVHDVCVAESIDSDHVDYRTRPGNRYRPIALPPAVAAGCAALTATLEVPFLGVDFKVRAATGEWFFLEANSMPCYQGYDRRAGGAIARAIVGWLSGG